MMIFKYAYSEIFTTSITSHSYLVCVVRMLTTCPFSQRCGYSAVLLTVVTMLYSRAPEPLVPGTLYPVASTPHLPLPPPLLIIILLSVSMSSGFFLDSTYKWIIQHLFLSMWLQRQDFLLFHGGIILHFMYTPHSLCPFIP